MSILGAALRADYDEFKKFYKRYLATEELRKHYVKKARKDGPKKLREHVGFSFQNDSRRASRVRLTQWISVAKYAA